MDSKRLIMLLSLTAIGTLYWLLVCHITGTSEPWDADDYWRLWYPLSLALSAIAGLTSQRRGWLAGAILTFAQLPVMWLHAGVGPLMPAGLAILIVLALPAAVISHLSARVAARLRST